MFGLFSKKPKEFKAQVQPAGDTLVVNKGDNLLKAALAAGLDWPHDCRVGSCGNCRCKVTSGKIKALSDFSYVLDGPELKEGMVLACQTQLKSDIEVEVELGDGEDSAAIIANVDGVLEKTRLLTHDIMELTIKLDACFPHAAEPGVNGHGYRAGQYADLVFQGTNNGIDKARSYSFAKAPADENENELTFYVRKVPGGALTSWLFANDRIGSRVTVNGPYGSFWLRDGEGPVICIAGGSGMSSIMALLQHAKNINCQREKVYLFGARSQADLYCEDELKALETKGGGNVVSRLRYLPVLSEEPENSDWQGLRGMVTDQVAGQPLDWMKTQAYLCGPPPMIDAAIAVLKLQGVKDENIYFDKFLDASSMPSGRV